MLFRKRMPRKIPDLVETIWASYQYKVPKHKTSVHIAVVIHKNKVISVGQNRVGSRSRGLGFSDRTIHAERDALKQVDHKCLEGSVMYVARLSKDGSLTNSEPCAECKRVLGAIIEKYGLRAVFYTC